MRESGSEGESVREMERAREGEGVSERGRQGASEKGREGASERPREGEAGQ